MQTDKPLISISMAVYEPRIDWLRQQLTSLNAQTYPNLALDIIDDCSPSVSFRDIEALVAECITAFPYTIEQNEKNIGSNATFEKLTERAAGDYIAYCDQDDIWLPEKLAVLQEAIERENAQLACSDMYIIDGDGQPVADSITKIRRHHIFRSGDGLTDTLWYSNFASGCALLVRGETAKQALPLNPYMYYDHYIAFCSAYYGRIAFLNQRLLQHREHGDNQSSTMQGVVDKESYRRLRVEKPYHAVQWLARKFTTPALLAETLKNGEAWLHARLCYLNGQRRAWRTMFQYRRYSPMATLFEIISPFLPTFMFRLCIHASKKNII